MNLHLMVHGVGDLALERRWINCGMNLRQIGKAAMYLNVSTTTELRIIYII